MVNAMEPTALVIEHTIKKGSELRYEGWLARILEATTKAPGYLGREVFPPGTDDKPYITIVRFRTSDDLQKWLGSKDRKAFINEIQDTLQHGDKTSIKAGIDVWFTPADAPTRPPAYKQFLLTIAAIYPLTILIPGLLSPALEAFSVFRNRFVGGLIINIVIVGLMTYLIMPNLTHWLRHWLFRPVANSVGRHSQKVDPDRAAR